MRVYLVCIRTGNIRKKSNTDGKVRDHLGFHLVKGKKYSSDRMTLCEDGLLCYEINEFRGYNLRLAERFREVDPDHIEVIEEETVEELVLADGTLEEEPDVTYES